MKAYVRALTPEDDVLSPGKGWELDIFGVTWNFSGRENQQHQNYHSSRREVSSREYVGWKYDPRNPTKGLNGELFDGVCRFLPKRRRRFLSYNLAIGSNYDYWHGIDSYFCMEGVFVTFDGTISRWKEDKKADFLITPSDCIFKNGTPVGFKKEFLKKIARRLLERYIYNRRGERASNPPYNPG